MNDLVTKLREDNEMLRDGYQENLTRTWHDHAMQNAAQDCLEAADHIEAQNKIIEDLREQVLDYSHRIDSLYRKLMDIDRAEYLSKSNPNTPERNDE